MRFIFALILSSLVFLPLHADSQRRLQAIYSSLDQTSLSQLLAFYHIHPDTELGKLAKQKAIDLINKHRKIPIEGSSDFVFSLENLEPILSLMTKQSDQAMPAIDGKKIEIISRIASHLQNRSLKGFNLTNTEELRNLPSHEVDLARGLFLLQFGEKEIETVQRYEAALDLMALQVLAHLPKDPSKKEIMETISHFIFHEMRFRFPPHSMWAKDVDLYTFLPSVLDSRHGVCLGVSILYLCIAQRLGVELNIITPPGHIYLSYTDIDREINIETTARGIDYPTDNYLGINTKTLTRHDLKAVLGLYFMNAAATAWQMAHHKEAIDLYLKARPFLPDYALIETFLGYNYLFVGNKKEAERCFQIALKNPSSDSLYSNETIEDYLAGHVSSEGIQAVYQEVDATRDSILAKQKKLMEICQKFPKFRDGIFHLAVTWLQLGRTKEALEILEQYHMLDANNPIVEYYLTLLCIERMHLTKAKQHYKQCEKILLSHGHFPKAMKQLKTRLQLSAPFDP